MTRFLGLDVGDRRIGIAVSDLLGVTAQGVETYTRTDELQKDLDYIGKLAKDKGAARLIVGMPRNMNGSYGEQAQKVRVFAEALEAACGLPVEYCDERLTSISARRVLLDADISRKKQKKVIDKLAAVLILQSYLDMHAS